MGLYKIPSEIAGVVAAIEVNEGDAVSEGDIIMMVESMKMEIPIMAQENGVIKEILVEEGSIVNEGETIIILEK